MPAHRRQILSATALTLLLTSPASQAGLDDLLKRGQEMLGGGTTASQDRGGSDTTATSSLDSTTLSSGLKEALTLGTERAVAALAQENGYLDNADVRIQLPGALQTGADLLRRAGLDSQVEAFELSMNRAAESAVTEATPIFADAITSMTIEDAQRIYSGGDTAATDYFRERTWDQLADRFKPLIKSAMQSNNVTGSYEGLMNAAQDRVPMLGSFNLDLADHVTTEALEGLFLMLSRQEQLIREEPVARTTDLLKQVFGN